MAYRRPKVFFFFVWKTWQLCTSTHHKLKLCVRVGSHSLAGANCKMGLRVGHPPEVTRRRKPLLVTGCLQLASSPPANIHKDFFGAPRFDQNRFVRFCQQAVCDRGDRRTGDQYWPSPVVSDWPQKTWLEPPWHTPSLGPLSSLMILYIYGVLLCATT